MAENPYRSPPVETHYLTRKERLLKVAPMFFLVLALMAINSSIGPYVRGQRTHLEPGRLAAAATFPLVFFSLAAIFWWVRRHSLQTKG